MQQREITVFQPEEVGGPLREYRTSAEMLNFVECSNSGTLKAASSIILETTCSAPTIPGSPKNDILHSWRKVLLEEAQPSNKSVGYMPGNLFDFPTNNFVENP